MNRSYSARSAAAFAAILAILATSRSAAADKKECAQAYVEGQKAMKSNALRKARDQLRICARDECMPAIRKDCVGWVGEVTAAIPSIVVEAKGIDGKETFDVSLYVDDALVANKLDVQGVELDPGTFRLRFEHAGAPPIEKELVIRQGQKNKVVEVSFAPRPTSNVPRGEGDRARADVDLGPSGERPVKTLLPWVLGGGGVLAVGGGAVLWALAESSRSDLSSKNCAPICNPDDVDAIKRNRLVGDILFGAGVVAIGVAAYLLLTPPTPSRSRAYTWLSATGVRF